MTTKKIMPQDDELISLLCLDCKSIFTGQNPKGLTLFGYIIKRPMCPKCGSKRIASNSFALYKR